MEAREASPLGEGGGASWGALGAQGCEGGCTGALGGSFGRAEVSLGGSGGGLAVGFGRLGGVTLGGCNGCCGCGLP